MLFNSLEFLIFLVIVFALYWMLPAKKTAFRNVLLLVSSYIFYGRWDWRFLILIAFSSAVDFGVGYFMNKQDKERNRKLLLYLSLAVNLGLLGLYKYYDFFISEFNDMLGQFGMQTSTSSLNLILPVGISFYTFQSMSYSIDVYRRKLEPSKDILQFFTYVSFFPQLVAGPIERAKNLLPQFKTEKRFDYDLAVSGIYQMIWGFFKKIVIADNCALLVNDIFNQDAYASSSSATLALGAVLFAFQIYGDFSGYSDIAIGIAKLFGINLMKNFDYPYFSRDIAEFWRKWHISLSRWFQDYVYIPLGGSRGGKLFTLRNVFIIFVVSGFWHGANWTYIMWGFFNALLFVPLYVFNLNRSNLGHAAQGRLLPSIKELGLILLTFFFTCIAWVFFRADTLSRAWEYLGNAFSNFSTQGDAFIADNALNLKIAGVMILFLLIIEWCNRDKEYGMEFNSRITKKIISYTSLILIFFYGKFDYQEFIYFQF